VLKAHCLALEVARHQEVFLKLLEEVLLVQGEFGQPTRLMPLDLLFKYLTTRF
tara:strand:- start:133 stop:291 length:159 start_codon:yes stop_codon:yes gene_type:complete